MTKGLETFQQAECTVRLLYSSPWRRQAVLKAARQQMRRWRQKRSAFPDSLPRMDIKDRKIKHPDCGVTVRTDSNSSRAGVQYVPRWFATQDSGALCDCRARAIAAHVVRCHKMHSSLPVTSPCKRKQNILSRPAIIGTCGGMRWKSSTQRTQRGTCRLPPGTARQLFAYRGRSDH